MKEIICKIILIVVFLIVNVALAKSQSNDCDICGLALKYAQNEYVYDNYSKFLITYDKVLNMNEEEYEKQTSREVANLYSPKYGSFDYNSDKKKVKEYLQNFNIEEKIRQSQEVKTFISQKIGNPYAYQSFDKCIEACMRSDLSIVVPVIENESEFTLKILARSRPGIKSVKISNIIIKNAYFVQGKLEIGMLLSTSQPTIVSMKKSASKEARIYIVFEEEAGRTNDIRIPAVKPKPIPQDTRTIVSILSSEYIPSKSFNICNNCLNYGNGLITNNSAKAQYNQAFYKANFEGAGKYNVYIEYAAGESRPIEVSINRVLINSNACNRPTGGWNANNVQKVLIGECIAKKGVNEIKLYRSNYFPHIGRIIFKPI
ncbi:carbohydrate-binding protein [Neolewinella persica]|uniref:hypothetical protein n=1 Tax=Neolewinella persica TaxID=70998 RepID=UPI0003694EB2|nr:hypothetical protein [Neolewinella persica]